MYHSVNTCIMYTFVTLGVILRRYGYKKTGDYTRGCSPKKGSEKKFGLLHQERKGQGGSTKGGSGRGLIKKRMGKVINGWVWVMVGKKTWWITECCGYLFSHLLCQFQPHHAIRVVYLLLILVSKNSMSIVDLFKLNRENNNQNEPVLVQ